MCLSLLLPEHFQLVFLNGWNWEERANISLSAEFSLKRGTGGNENNDGDVK